MNTPTEARNSDEALRQHICELWEADAAKYRKYTKKSHRYYLFIIIMLVATQLLELFNNFMRRNYLILFYVLCATCVGTIVLLIMFIRHIRKPID